MVRVTKLGLGVQMRTPEDQGVVRAILGEVLKAIDVSMPRNDYPSYDLGVKDPTIEVNHRSLTACPTTCTTSSQYKRRLTVPYSVQPSSQPEINIIAPQCHALYRSAQKSIFHCHLCDMHLPFISDHEMTSGHRHEAWKINCRHRVIDRHPYLLVICIVMAAEANRHQSGKRHKSIASGHACSTGLFI